MTETGIRYATTDNVTLRAGQLYADAPAVALEPGRAGNVAANTITIMAASRRALIRRLSAAEMTLKATMTCAAVCWTAISVCQTGLTPLTMNRRRCPALAWRRLSP